ncbi:MAG: hypothetical protein KBG19_00520 [Bacteroidales bacterium]|nr:hypothetical protein [Bacteroidales bacterium]
MVTDELIKKSFISQIIRRDAAFIYDTQARVVRENFSTDGRSSTLAYYLSKRPFSLSGQGLNLVYYFNVITYLRFLDIKYSKDKMGLRSKLALYNRVIWGRLYNETIRDLKYGLTEDIKRDIRQRLEKMNPTNAEIDTKD